MGGGLESRCVGRVYGADGARHHPHRTHGWWWAHAPETCRAKETSINYIFASSWHFTLFRNWRFLSSLVFLPHSSYKIRKRQNGYQKLTKHSHARFEDLAGVPRIQLLWGGGPYRLLYDYHYLRGRSCCNLQIVSVQEMLQEQMRRLATLSELLDLGTRGITLLRNVCTCLPVATA